MTLHLILTRSGCREQEAGVSLPRVICEVSESISIRVAELDLTALRAVFSDMFDRANNGVQAARLDADDVVLERFVTVQGPGGVEFTAAVEWLSDGRRLIADVLAAGRRSGCPCVLCDDLVLRAARVRAVVEDSP